MAVFESKVSVLLFKRDLSSGEYALPDNASLIGCRDPVTAVLDEVVQRDYAFSAKTRSYERR